MLNEKLSQIISTKHRNSKLFESTNSYYESEETILKAQKFKEFLNNFDDENIVMPDFSRLVQHDNFLKKKRKVNCKTECNE